MASAWRVGVVAVALCGLVIACGDDDSRVGVDLGDGVEAGFFIGTTRQGDPLALAVDSIGAVFVVCGGPIVFTRYDPPEPIAIDGSFAVEASGAGRVLTVSGRFLDQERVRGDVSGDPFCDGRFDARRCDPATQACGDADGDRIPDEVDPDLQPPTPTPVATPTAGGPTVTGGATPTDGAPTVTLEPTPVPTPTPEDEEFCGNGIVDGDEECDGADLDDFTCFDLCDQDDEGGVLSCNSNCTFNFSQCPGQDCEF